LLRVQHGKIRDLALKLCMKRTYVLTAILQAKLMSRSAKSPPFLPR
jgi:hypothetical protein